MSRGLNKMPVFKENRERTRFLNLIRENLEKYDVEIYSYCIMPNHFHLLIKADLEELASFMAKVLATFAKYYNQKHNRVGYVFQGRYKSQCVDNIGYFWNCLRYIHNNPLHLKDVESILDYKYSSMKELYYGKKDLLTDFIFELVTERFGVSESFFDFHRVGSWCVFDDIEEELKANKIRIAKEILEEFEVTYETKAIEIIDYIELRKQLREKMIAIMNITVREANEIINNLREELSGTG